MFNFNNIFRIAAAATASVALLVSCAGLEQDQNDAVGYLAAPALDVDLTVDDLLLTKALDFDVEEPALSDIHFIVKDKNGTVRYDEDGLWNEPIVLPVGGYSIEASYGTNGFDEPYFTGLTTGTIEQLDKEIPKLSLALSNSLVRVTLDESLAGHFNCTSIIMNPGAYEASCGSWFYVPAGAEINLLLTGTNSVGKSAKFSYNLSAPAAKTAYDIVCKQSSTSWPEITMSAVDMDNVWASIAYVYPATFENISDENKDAVVYEAIPATATDWSSPLTPEIADGMLVFKNLTSGTEYKVRARVGTLTSNEVSFTPSVDGISVTATHTYSNNELDGTDVTSAFLKSDLIKSLISSWTINLCKADGTILRSALSLGTSDGSLLTANGAWPYLPKGNYKLSISVLMQDGETVETEIPFATTDPTISVTAYGKTTYDYWLDGDLNNANAVSGSQTSQVSIPSQSLFEIGSKVSISSNLMKNSNYSKTAYYAAYKDDTIIVDYSCDYGTSNEQSLGRVENIFTDWRSYDLSVTVTFAGQPVIGTKTFNITGLPYEAAPPTNSGDHPWTEDQRGWGVVYFQWNDTEFITWNTTGSGNTNIIGSPIFNIPSEIPIYITMQAHGHYRKVVIDYKYHVDTKVHSGGKTVSMTVDGSDLTYDTYNINTLSLTPGNPKVQIENTHVSGDNRRLYIKSVSFTYR